MASILLPTQRWTPACEQLLAQLTPDDELLFICDSSDDPLASHPSLQTALTDPSRDIRLLIAGEPERCSGKANAIAHGLEHASPEQDRFILTDDDFDHGENWLARVKCLGKQHPDRAVSGIPVFVSGGRVWQVSEPTSIVLGSLILDQRNGVWGGCITFTRAMLDLDAYIRDLRQTVSDDGLLWEYLDADHGGVGVYTTRDLTFEVPVPGGFSAVLNRHVRNNQILYRTDPMGVLQGLLILLVFAAVSVFAPVFAGGFATLYAAVVYWYLGVERWTWMLAFPSILLAVPMLGYCLVQREFWWGGRKYRWHSKFDVEIIATDADRQRD